ncbi:MAG: GxxExxY protein, partial [Candidatus Brocadiia bacterium]
GITFERQVSLPITYGEVRLDCGYRLDLVVDGRVIVEVKAVDKLLSIHEAQLLSYLKLSGLTVGLLLNFNVKMLKNGVQRIVNQFPDGASTGKTGSKIPTS